MAQVGIQVNTITFNVLIDGYAKSGQMHQASAAYREMQARGLVPDSCTFNIIAARAHKFRLCWDHRLDDAWELRLGAIEQGVPLRVTGFNALIAAYNKEGLHEEASELYRIINKLGLTPSSSTFNYLIMGLCNQTDFIAFSAYINGRSRLDYVNEAYQAFAEMTSRGIVPNNITYNSIISALCKAGNMTEAFKLEQNMRQSGLVPDIYTSNILIDGLCREGKLKMVDNLLLDMCSNGLTPDTVTYNTIINAYCRAQDMNSAMNFMNKMLVAGCEPDIFTYNIWMHSLYRNHMLNQAGKLLDELVAVDCSPNSVTYNTLMDGICSDVLDRAMILTGRLIKMAFKPNTITLNVFLSHFCKQGFGNRALMWAEKLREDSYVFYGATRNIIDWARREMEDDPQANNEDIGRCMFLEFLMFMTYEAMLNSRSSKATHMLTEKGFDPASNSMIRKE
ncbi:Tetratricopeptide repeat-like superfamily protein, partial [Zea mays]